MDVLLIRYLVLLIVTLEVIKSQSQEKISGVHVYPVPFYSDFNN